MMDRSVWDKAASMRFKRPGRGTACASFRVSEEQIEEIREAVKREGKVEKQFVAEVKDDKGTVIGKARKVLHVRRKQGA